MLGTKYIYIYITNDAPIVLIMMEITMVLRALALKQVYHKKDTIKYILFYCDNLFTLLLE